MLALARSMCRLSLREGMGLYLIGLPDRLTWAFESDIAVFPS
jgi:hypothetical protein